jgi:hypothetical protein
MYMYIFIYVYINDRHIYMYIYTESRIDILSDNKMDVNRPSNGRHGTGDSLARL